MRAQGSRSRAWIAGGIAAALVLGAIIAWVAVRGIGGGPSEPVIAGPMASTPAAAEKPSKHGVAWVAPTGVAITNEKGGKGGIALVLEYLIFNADKKMSGAPGGAILQLEGTPVGLLLYGLNSPGNGSMAGKYGDIEIDVSDLEGKEPNLHMIQEVTPQTKYICDVTLRTAGHKSIAISMNYVVFADGKNEGQRGGPYVRLRFDSKNAGSDNAQIAVTRNGKEVAKPTMAAMKKDGLLFGGVQTADDVVEWRVLDAQSNAVNSGSLGFPISGQSSDLVEYSVDLDHK